MEKKPLSKNMKLLIVIGVVASILYLLYEYMFITPQVEEENQQAVRYEDLIPEIPVADFSEAQEEPNLNGSIFTNVDETYSIDIPAGWEITDYSYDSLQGDNGLPYFNERLMLEKDGVEITFSNFDGPSYNCYFGDREDMLYAPNLGFYDELETISTDFHDEVVVGKLVDEEVNEIGFCVQDDLLGEDVYGSRIIGDTAVLATFPEEYTEEMYNEVVNLVDSVIKI